MYSKLVVALAVSFVSLCQASPLSKKDAFEILKSKGFKWNLTETLRPEAEAKLNEAQSELSPRVGLGFRQYAARINPIQFGGANAETIDTVGFGTTALELTWTLMDSVAKAKILTAEANAMVSSAQSKHYQSELTALMLVQYLNVQRLHKQLDLMEANLQRSELIVKLANAKKSVGAGIPLDVARAKNLVQLDQLKKIGIQLKYSKAQHDLALLLSNEANTRNLEPLRPRLFSVEKSNALVAKASEKRNDLKAAEFAVDAASKAQGEASKMYFPKLSLLAEVGTTQPTMFGWPAKSANGFLGVSLSIPLVTGGLIEAKKKEVAVLHQKADLQLKQTRAEVSQQVQEAIEQLTAAEEALNASADYLKTSESENQIAESRYRSGASNILELTNAHTSLASASDMRIENVFNYEAAKVNYFRALGDFTEYFNLEAGDIQ